MTAFLATNKLRILVCLLVLALSFTATIVFAEEDGLNHDYDEEITKHLELFHYAEDVVVLGPTSFPRPTDNLGINVGEGEQIVPYLKPVHGEHRPDKDAVVAFAAEYPLSNYVTFIESLRAGGFDGDIVLAISPLDVKKEDVWAYLSEPDNHVVLYAPVLVCFNAEREEVESAKGGIRTCISDNLYARKKSNGGELEPLPDPRSPRTVQTLRYEVYWLMCLSISPHSWILLVDARDTVFQLDPFAHVPRNSDPTLESGLLYFFGEAPDATRLGKSKQNNKWIAAAYGDRVAELLADKPTVCSGATMGEQIALETYMRAMVAEADYTGTVLAGADQGFHNFLHYSHKFKYTEKIHSVVVFDQGQGIVNNLGALRTKGLEEWGNGKLLKTEVDKNEKNHLKKFKYTILNWDGTISPVVHQYDRHKQLSDFFYKVKGGEYMDNWHKRQKKLQKEEK